MILEKLKEKVWSLRKTHKVLFVFWATSAVSAFAALLVSASYIIQRVWVGGGGNRATSASYQNTASVGQGIAGNIVSGGAFRLRGGFIQPTGVVASTGSVCAISDPNVETVCTIAGPYGLITVTVPAAAVSTSGTIALSLPITFTTATAPLSSATALNRGVSAVLTSGLSLRKPLRIDFPYQDSEAPSGDETRLRLAFFDSPHGVWGPVPGRQDTGGNQLTIFSMTDGVFQLMEISPSSDIDQVRVGPNPLRPGLGHRQMVFSNLPAGTSVKIFTQSGELVRSLWVDAGGQSAWDGVNNDGDKVVSGVYFAVLEQGGSHRLMSVAVER